MTKISTAICLLLGVAGAAQAHQIWIEQGPDQKAVVRFGEFGENLRETSPGLLDKFGKPVATLVSASGEKTADAGKAATGFTLPFGAGNGDSIIAEDARYPLYTWKQAGKDTTNWFHPSARLITSFADTQPKLALDLVPAGRTGEFKLYFNGQPKAKTKVTLVTQSGWAKEAFTDDDGRVRFDMPWQGTYVAEVSLNERTPGERSGAGGAEKYDGVSYVTTTTYVKADGLPPVPAAPAAPAATPAAAK